MAGQVQALRRRIRTVKSTKKIAKAQELVATSRIAKAQERVNASKPYAEAITRVLTALASNATIDNPLLQSRERVRRAGVLLITSDRGLAERLQRQRDPHRRAAHGPAPCGRQGRGAVHRRPQGRRVLPVP
nr:hypothetical protein GCM10020092_015590 [Actinoplanes digitatis]